MDQGIFIPVNQNSASSRIEIRHRTAPASPIRHVVAGHDGSAAGKQQYRSKRTSMYQGISADRLSSDPEPVKRSGMFFHAASILSTQKLSIFAM
ncbi:MAG: hypothetical protein ACLRZL_12405 [Alistipes communis]